MVGLRGAISGVGCTTCYHVCASLPMPGCMFLTIIGKLNRKSGPSCGDSNTTRSVEKGTIRLLRSLTAVDGPQIHSRTELVSYGDSLYSSEDFGNPRLYGPPHPSEHRPEVVFLA